jgi:hypothetical protein
MMTMSLFFLIQITYAENKVISHNETKPLILRSIMFDLATNMQAITLAIARENWTQVSHSALLIADHPQPPMTEKVRILSFVGKNMSQFKTYDGQTHDTAMQLSQMAKKNQGEKIIALFADLQRTCLACHQQFRQSFQQHFYPE